MLDDFDFVASKMELNETQTLWDSLWLQHGTCSGGCQFAMDRALSRGDRANSNAAP